MFYWVLLILTGFDLGVRHLERFPNEKWLPKQGVVIAHLSTLSLHQVLVDILQIFFLQDLTTSSFVVTAGEYYGILFRVIVAIGFVASAAKSYLGEHP